MVGHLLGAVIGDIAHWDVALGGGGRIHRIISHAVSDNRFAALEPRNALPSNRDVMPNDQDAGVENFLVEI